MKSFAMILVGVLVAVGVVLTGSVSLLAVGALATVSVALVK